MVGLKALSWEAGRRGISYGELVARLSVGEGEEIEARYTLYLEEKRRERAARRKKKRK